MNRRKFRIFFWRCALLTSAALSSLPTVGASAPSQSNDELELAELKTTAAENKLAQVNSGIANVLDSVGGLEGVANPGDFPRTTPGTGFAEAVGGVGANIADSASALSRLTGAAQASASGLGRINGAIQGAIQGQDPISQSDAINISR